MQFRTNSILALSLLGALGLGLSACDGDDPEGNGTANGNPDMGPNGDGGNMGSDGGNMGSDGGTMTDGGGGGGSDGGGGGSDGGAAELTSITFDPPMVTVQVGSMASVTVVGNFDDNTTQNLDPGAVQFSVDDATVASVAASGDGTLRIGALMVGSTNVVVTAEGVTGTLGVTVESGVSLVGITLVSSGDPLRLEEGETEDILASGQFSDNTSDPLDPTTLTLTSGDSAICTIAPAPDNTQIRVTAVAEGSTTLTVARNGIMETIGCEVTGPDPCPFGDEGCACTPANTVNMDGAGVTPETFGQSDCNDSALRCVPHDRFSRFLWPGVFGGTFPDSTQLPDGSAASCLRNCEEDSDCGMGPNGEMRFCQTDFRFFVNIPSGGLDGICVDRLAGPDEACKLSRRTTENFAGCTQGGNPANCPRLVDTQELVGCEEGLTCFTNLLVPLRGNYLGVPLAYPDEGICTELCQNDMECDAAATPDRRTCAGPVDPMGGNATRGPIFSNFGLCVDEVKEHGDRCALPPMGADWNSNEWCYGQDDIDLTCLGIGDGGYCVEQCPDGTCTSSVAGVAPDDYVCDLATDTCDVSTCGADQGYFNDCAPGRMCRELLQTTTDMNGNTVIAATPSVCGELITPSLAPGEVTPAGGVMAGDDCLPMNPTLADLFSCEEGFTCVGIPAQAGAGLENCLPFCDPSSVDSADYCEDLIGPGSTCIDASNALTDLLTGQPLTEAGVCTTP